jgi:hypothetical protein
VEVDVILRLLDVRAGRWQAGYTRCMNSSAKPCAALWVAAGSLLASQLAFAEERSLPSLQPSDVPLGAAAPPEDAHCIPSWVIDAAGTRRLPDRCLENGASSESAPADTDPRCDPPWFIDAKGIRRVRQECMRSPAQPAAAAPAGGIAAKGLLAPAASGSQPDVCEQPFWLDQHGIKRLKRQCLGPATAALPAPDAPARTLVPLENTADARNCAPPFWVDQHGIKRLKRQCL